MMNVIRTYTLMGKDTLNMPIGARVLTVALERGRPMLYALIDPDETREIERVFVTVHSYSEHAGELDYIGTFVGEGASASHVFEVLL